MGQKVLLIGNDINNATESYSWDDLINGLLDFAKIDRKLNKINKPFPLLYEEIYLRSAGEFGTTESSIKKFIATQTEKLKANELHKKILDLGIEDILTTNYDLSFESTSGLTQQECKNQGTIKESTYNLFRYHKTAGHKIWHIHGSRTNPRSITLGYEHYSGYLQQMRNYTATGITGTYKAKDFLSLIRRIKEKDIQYESWIDFFFTKDIYIFGLNLDFVEMHLWWLFTYRARVKVENRINVSNKIVYFYPDTKEKESQHKLEMLRAVGIEAVSEKLASNDKMKYYLSIINKIKRD
jgi:hypothetical protein